MQDLEIEGHCVFRGVFMTFFGVCVASRRTPGTLGVPLLHKPC